LKADCDERGYPPTQRRRKGEKTAEREKAKVKAAALESYHGRDDPAYRGRPEHFLGLPRCWNPPAPLAV
jgi:hypothetical protein